MCNLHRCILFWDLNMSNGKKSLLEQRLQTASFPKLCLISLNSNRLDWQCFPFVHISLLINILWLWTLNYRYISCMICARYVRCWFSICIYSFRNLELISNIWKFETSSHAPKVNYACYITSFPGFCGCRSNFSFRGQRARVSKFRLSFKAIQNTQGHETTFNNRHTVNQLNWGTA